MTPESQPQGVILTDPKPFPRDERCPKCQAKPDTRIDAAGFGRVRVIVCGVCGYEFNRSNA
jgi:rubredoxin